jgi:triosephosphate isomerase
MSTPRRLFVAGNWKMNLTRAQGVKLAGAVVEQQGKFVGVDIAVCPAFPYLAAVHEVVAGSRVALGAQNMYFEKSGAFTGEVSAAMLADCGCTYAILGHSERRHVLGETNEHVNRKLHAALAAGIKPILCVGELLAERQAGRTHDVVAGHVRGGLMGVRHENVRDVTIAYEPVWAIGTGVVATPEQAEDAHAFIRRTLTEMFGADLAQVVRIQYGGSVKPDNAGALLQLPNVDGALVGGASLKAEDFLGILHAAVGVKK